MITIKYYLEDFSFLDPWVKDESKVFLDQLIKEIGPNHLLSKVKLKPIARRYDRDDVLYQFENESDKFVEVHLTWSKDKNKDWPKVYIYDSFEEWINKKMIPDNRVFE